MQKIYLTIIILNSFIIGVPAQDLLKGDPFYLKTSQNIKNINFFIYRQPFKAQKKYQKVTDSNYEYPEQLFESLVSSKSAEWHQAISLEKIERPNTPEYYRNKEKWDKNKSYIELKCKLCFEQENEKKCLIKYYVHSENLETPMCGVQFLKNVSNKWYFTTDGIDNLTYLFLVIDENKLKIILQGKKTDENEINELKEIIKENDTISFDKLYLETDKWTKNNDLKKIFYFLDLNSWALNKYEK